MCHNDTGSLKASYQRHRASREIIDSPWNPGVMCYNYWSSVLWCLKPLKNEIPPLCDRHDRFNLHKCLRCHFLILTHPDTFVVAAVTLCLYVCRHIKGHFKHFINPFELILNTVFRIFTLDSCIFCNSAVRIWSLVKTVKAGVGNIWKSS